MGANGRERDHIIKLAAEIAAQVALKTYREEAERIKKEQADRRLRNTKLLLRNYRMFKAHAENAVYTAQEACDDDAYDIIDLMSDRFSDNDVFVESIKRSVERTVTIVNHIDTMLKLYEVYCNRSGSQEEIRRWHVINGMYISEQPKTVKQIANDFVCAERTIYRDIDDACEKIAALIFGIDGIRR